MNRSQKDVNKEQQLLQNIWLEITLSLDWHTNKNKQSISNQVSTKRTTNHELAFTRTLPNANVRFQGCGVNLKCFMKFWSRIWKWLHAETAFRLSKSFLWLFSLELKELLHLFNVLDICDSLHDLGSVTIWRLHGRSNACECMLTLFPTFMSFLSVCMS